MNPSITAFLIFGLLASGSFTTSFDSKTSENNQQSSFTETSYSENVELKNDGSDHLARAIQMFYWEFSNDPKIMDLLKTAASMGNVVAEGELAKQYWSGTIVRQDRSFATDIVNGIHDELMDLASSGNDHASYLLGYIFEHGFGEPKSEEAAIYWYEKAVFNSGYPIAAYAAGWLIRAYDFDIAYEYLTISAEGGYPSGYYGLGYVYEFSRGERQSFNKAANNYRRAVELNGHPIAAFRLALIYDFGKGRNHNWTEARKYYQIAADNGNTEAQVALGEMYYFGVGGLRQSESQARNIFRSAKQNGSEKAEKYLLVMDHLYLPHHTTVDEDSGLILTVRTGNNTAHVMSNVRNTWRFEIEVKHPGGAAGSFGPAEPGTWNLFGYSEPTEIFPHRGVSGPINSIGGGKQEFIIYPLSHPVRAIGFIYVYAYFGNDRLIYPVPMAIAWPDG